MTRYGLCPGIMSLTELLDGFSFGFPWFNSVALLRRSLTGQHILSYILSKNCSTDRQSELRFVAPANMLRTSITPLDMKVSISEHILLVTLTSYNLFSRQKKIVSLMKMGKPILWLCGYVNM